MLSRFQTTVHNLFVVKRIMTEGSIFFGLKAKSCQTIPRYSNESHCLDVGIIFFEMLFWSFDCPLEIIFVRILFCNCETNCLEYWLLAKILSASVQLLLVFPIWTDKNIPKHEDRYDYGQIFLADNSVKTQRNTSVCAFPIPCRYSFTVDLLHGKVKKGYSASNLVQAKIDGGEKT